MARPKLSPTSDAADSFYDVRRRTIKDPPTYHKLTENIPNDDKVSKKVCKNLILFNPANVPRLLL